MRVHADRLGQATRAPRRSKVSASSRRKTPGKIRKLTRIRNHRALLVLRNRVNELEAQLAVASTSGQALDPTFYDQGISSLAKETAVEVSEVDSLDTNPESAADILATGAFDRLTPAEIGYFGE